MTCWVGKGEVCRGRVGIFPKELHVAYKGEISFSSSECFLVKTPKFRKVYDKTNVNIFKS